MNRYLHSTLVRMYILFLCSSAVVLFLGACASSKHCASEPAEGNLGSVVNSSADEFAPVQFGKTTLLISSTNRERQKPKAPSDEAVLVSEFNKGYFSMPSLAKEFPMNDLPNSGYPTFYTNPITKTIEAYFAVRTGSGVKTDVNIFTSTRRAGGEWSKPQALDANINSPTWDDQPTISPDGSYLIFASDRAGGLGGIDLYICKRMSDRSWSKPENLGNTFNSEFDEFSPYIAPDGTLYYSTKSFSKGKDFDIVSANKTERSWNTPKQMPAPINSEADDISPSWWGDSLMLASNRKGGCGGFDLYAFQLCGPVIIRGGIQTSDTRHLPLAGKIEAIDDFGTIVSSLAVGDDGTFQLSVPAKKNLLVRYTAPCVPGKYEQRITTLCSETSTVMMNLDFKVKESAYSFMLDTNKYTIPFFVSGYYIPNTPENLSDLRLKFSYNLIGHNDSSRYVSNPSSEYDDYALMVDSALNEAYQFIVQRFDMLEYNPCREAVKTIEVSIEGYADPRGIYGQARYVGDEVNNEDLNVHIPRGEKMTNELLSELRAYYTVKYLQSKLEKNPLYAKYASSIHWQAIGKGIDEQERENERKRRVGIFIKLSDEEVKTGR
ncbi:MAG: PD40 domain-containing protein [Bacteroidetes bacterium]|nr:PD40 domain-containing protein [Bacteroidota bacterium]